jgi:hypothetical protein
VNPEYILCEVTPPDDRSIESFRLYDDGSSVALPAHPYAGEFSGDIVPNNDKYTRTINGHLLAMEVGGDYLFSFSVPGQTDVIYSRQVTVQAANIEDCIIADAPTISGIDSCFDSILLMPEISISEPDSVTEVYGILLQEGTPIDTLVFTPDDVAFPLDEVNASSHWLGTLTPTTFPCAGTADNYSLRYEATTRFGMTCNSVTADFSILNDPQTISDLHGLPDSLQRPNAVGDTDTVVVTLKLDDCNLLGVLGYDGVRFDYKREPYDWQPHNPNYRLNDDGEAGDTTAGDGTYTVGLTFAHSDSLFNNIYIFRYYSVECAPPNVQTDYLYDTVLVWQDTTLVMTNGSPDVSDIGFRVLSPSATGGSR